jgi:hypothetical protein
MQPVEEMQVDEAEAEEPPVETLESGISAPTIHDSEEFQFEWPSEEIKRACEMLFPGSKEWNLPALNWIAEERQEDNTSGEQMQDIQQG